jgi:hypothetical protein
MARKVRPLAIAAASMCGFADHGGASLHVDLRDDKALAQLARTNPGSRGNSHRSRPTARAADFPRESHGTSEHDT